MQGVGASGENARRVGFGALKNARDSPLWTVAKKDGRTRIEKQVLICGGMILGSAKRR